MTDLQISNQIYKSRDQIRQQIISLLKTYMELENVDLTKSSFLSFIVEVLSTLSSNLMFYQMSSYKEFFLTKAQLPDSIYNLAAFLGYKPLEATPAQVNILFKIPLTFQDSVATFTIPEFWKTKADGDIIFSTYYTTEIKVTNNSSVSIIVREGNRTYTLPYEVEDGNFLFILPFKQFTSQIQEFQVSEDLQQYQFSSIDVPFAGQISDIILSIKAPTSTLFEQYSEYQSLFLMSQNSKGYVLRKTDSGSIIQFGNGLIGYQPDAGSTVLVNLSLTKGSLGNVISGTIKTGDRIYHTAASGVTQVIQYDIINTDPAFNGRDEESLEEIRTNAITSISSLNRIVTENDFINSNLIIKDSPIGQNSLPVLKRSDLKVNEVVLFSTLFFGAELVPTRNLHAKLFYDDEVGNYVLSIGDTVLDDVPIDDGTPGDIPDDQEPEPPSPPSPDTLLRLWGWGNNSFKQLGIDDTTVSLPVQIFLDSIWSYISTGALNSLIIRNDGRLFGAGSNYTKQLGVGADTFNSFTQIGNDTNWSLVESSNSFSLGIKEDGTLWAWGFNNIGQLGLGDIIQRSVPTQVGDSASWISISSNYNHVLAVKDDGTLWAWGTNGSGALGLNDRINRSTPTQVGSDTNWSIAMAGNNLSCALKTNGTLWEWGHRYWDFWGQHGFSVYRSNPVQVGNVTTWETISFKNNHGIAKRTDGSIWTWGKSNNGRLGVGTREYNDQSLPVRVGSASDWKYVEAGINSTHAIKGNDSLWSWGSGPLGIGTIAAQSVPVQVSSATKWKTISVSNHAIAIKSEEVI